MVHEAFEITWCLAGSYVLSFTPSTSVRSASVAGAEMITFFTVPRLCLRASAPLVNSPVDSTTISAPTDAQSICAGSFTLKTLKALAVDGDRILGMRHFVRADCPGRSRTSAGGPGSSNR